jgi:hypothetical protein
MDPLRLMSVLPPPVATKVTRPMRDPNGSETRYNNSFSLRYADVGNGSLSLIFPELEKLNRGESNHASSYAINNLHEIAARINYMYARGDQINELVKRFHVDLEYATLLKEVAFKRDVGVGYFSGDVVYDCYKWNNLPFVTFALLLIPDRALVENWFLLFFGDAVQRQKKPENRSYFRDALTRAFLPDWSVSRDKYSMPKRSRPGERLEVVHALFRALSQPTSADKERAMADYMGRWNRMMTPYGWKPKRTYAPLAKDGRQIDPAVNSDSLFVEFAFEAALAVCAYDLDDSSFRDHPYYPRDLVDHYRAHVRNTRDAWRAVGVGPGIEIEAPPLPPKLDLAKSKSKGLERWLELVSDGDADAVAAVLEQVGKLRKVKDGFALSCALGENNAGLCADIKDDNTLAAQIDHLIDKRGLTGWNPSGLPAAGPDRCSGLLLALDRYLSDKPHVLRALGGEDDSWQGVVVPRMFEAEFAALSDALAIRTANPQQAYDI